MILLSLSIFREIEKSEKLRTKDKKNKSKKI